MRCGDTVDTLEEFVLWGEAVTHPLFHVLYSSEKSFFWQGAETAVLVGVRISVGAPTTTIIPPPLSVLLAELGAHGREYGWQGPI